MPKEQYRHVQTGWAIIWVMIAAATLLPLVALASGGSFPVALVGILLLPLAMFSTLTVVVDDTYLSFHFTLGLIRKRIPLRQIRQFAPVSNPWYYGWGIHLYPGGALYNVSGSRAVEILLKGGRRLRLGTDEPERVCSAIARVIGTPAPLSPHEQEQAKRSRKRWVTVTIAVLVLFSVGLGILVHLEEQPCRVTISPSTFEVAGVIYSRTLPLTEITGVDLCQHIPQILARTNGYSNGHTLRGHFRLAELGNGQLFIRLGVPPYLLVRTRTDYVIVNFRDPARTQALYAELLKQLSPKLEDRGMGQRGRTDQCRFAAAFTTQASVSLRHASRASDQAGV
jgi:hypothetical protein